MNHHVIVRKITWCMLFKVFFAIYVLLSRVPQNKIYSADPGSMKNQLPCPVPTYLGNLCIGIWESEIEKKQYEMESL